eukprot:2340803-Ditylum_brightwellii.AAC.1
MEQVGEERLAAVTEVDMAETGEALEEPARLVIGDGPGGTTLVDARNGFNKLSRMAMLWTVRHWWAQGAQFMFNCYRHWALLVIRQPGAPPAILQSREG